MQIGTFFSVSRQLSFFLLSVVVGAGMGVVYDWFRVFRIIFPPAAKPAATAVQDVIFWLIYGFVIFVWSAAVCEGELRFFMLFGSLMGFVLYILTLGNLVTGVLRRAVTAFYGLLQNVYFAIIYPTVLLLKKLCQKVYYFFVGNHKKRKSTEEV